MNIIIFATYFNKKVRFFLLILGMLFSATTLSAQIYELGVFAGGSNAVGDVGNESYIAPNRLAIGGVFKYNRSPRHTWRFSVLTSNLKMDDAKATATSRQQRGYITESAVTEFSAGLEFNFFDFNLHNLDTKVTPYVFTGLAYFRYESKYFTGTVSELDQKNSSFAIPMVVGIKAKLNRTFVLGAEVGARYTFVDDLDASNPRTDTYQQYRFGNLNSNDWYVFMGITLTVMFGQQPCYCSF